MKIIKQIKEYFKPKIEPIIPKIKFNKIGNDVIYVTFDADTETKCMQNNYHMLEFCNYSISTSVDFSNRYERITDGGIQLKLHNNYYKQFDIFENNSYDDFTLYTSGKYRELVETNIKLSDILCKN